MEGVIWRGRYGGSDVKMWRGRCGGVMWRERCGCEGKRCEGERCRKGNVM